jgi:hypothetical protein
LLKSVEVLADTPATFRTAAEAFLLVFAGGGLYRPPLRDEQAAILAIAVERQPGQINRLKEIPREVVSSRIVAPC